MKHEKITFGRLNDYRLKRLLIKCVKKENNLRKSMRILQHILSDNQKLDIEDKLEQYFLLRFSINYEIHQRKLKKSRKEKPNRLEVIDKNGRIYVNTNCTFELNYQDEGKTLKIFVK
jgi:hypothetical protein